MAVRAARTQVRCLALVAWLLSSSCPWAAGQEAELVSFSLIAAGTKCSNVRKDLSFSVDSAQKCAELVCADPDCGPQFEDRSHSRQGFRCSCLEAGQACLEVAD